MADSGTPYHQRPLVQAFYRHRGWLLLAYLIPLFIGRLLSDNGLRWNVLPVIAAAMLLRAWAGRHLGPHGNGATLEGDAIARTGPYAFSRHPLYLANIVSGVGLVLFANLAPELSLPVILAVLFHHLLLARFEESRLREAHAEIYEDYASTTPRWFGIKPPEAAQNPGGREGNEIKEGGEDDESRFARTENHAPETPRTPQARNLIYTSSAVGLVWLAERLSRLW